MRAIIGLLLFLTVCFVTIREAHAVLPKLYNVAQLRSTINAFNAYQEAHSINDLGVAAGIDQVASPYDGSGFISVATWNDAGIPTLISDPVGAPHINNLTARVDINSSGELFVRRASSSGPSASYYSPKTGWTLIPKMDGYAIGEDGSIVGVSTVGNVAGDGVIWKNGTFSPVTGMPDGLNVTSVVNIATDGTLAVNGRVGSDYATTAVRITPGQTGVKMDPALTYNPIVDVNTHGQGVGSTFSQVVRVYQNGTSVAPTFTQSTTFASGAAINDAGLVIGNAFYSTSIDQPFIVDLGASTNAIYLNNLIDPASRWRLLNVTDINNRGQIVGWGSFDNDNNPATPNVRASFRLDPVRTPGDTNYDNVVDFADLLTLAKNYNKSGDGTVFWESGDFNFDWTVNFDDLLTLAKNYTGTTAGASSENLDSTFASDWVLAESLVPEPASLCSGMLILPTLARRRR